MKLRNKEECSRKSPVRLLEIKDEECSDINTPVKVSLTKSTPLVEHAVKDSKLRKTRRTKSQKAGTTFPVDQIIKSLRKKKSDLFFSEESGVMIASVIEFLTAALLDSAWDMTQLLKQKRIMPKHVYLAIRTNKDLSYLFGNVLIPNGGELFQTWLSILSD